MPVKRSSKRASKTSRKTVRKTSRKTSRKTMKGGSKRRTSKQSLKQVRKTSRKTKRNQKGAGNMDVTFTDGTNKLTWDLENKSYSDVQNLAGSDGARTKISGLNPGVDLAGMLKALDGSFQEAVMKKVMNSRPAELKAMQPVKVTPDQYKAIQTWIGLKLRN